MSKDDIIKLIQPGNVDDQFTEILRNGARALLAQAVEAEVADFLSKHADLKTADGHQRVVRHGHLPEREVMTGICPVAIRQPRVRDREVDATDLDRIRFSPSILPPYMRRSKSIETLLPILYLKGISTGDFSEALAALLGKDAAGLSASAIGRLKDGWLDEHTAWQRRDLSAKRYVYIWADGIHLQARLEDEKQCILVADRRDAGRPQGTGRLHRWRPRERAGLARSAARPEAARARRAAAARHRRRRARVLEGCRRGLAESARAALLGAQDRECDSQVAEEPAAEVQTRVAGDLDGRNQGRRRAGVRRFHRELHAQIREGDRLPEQGSGHATGVLRLPGRALETPADDG
ncbi:hypothetical protein ACVII1_000127 [Bradyrhizobium elkanii]|uniref:Mutator family transposase n=1 Tax=Bradyrhizobium elkanii TaxID=29448 RepID=A0ABV4EQI2_BRAEL|nr:hypothetical protein [Bradyrhizobium elkanii]MCP1975845.1 hypothetical protein [Bradyrhizobium elkanii]MCP1985023.1 hypothetical protein [Bradyrhizobium elkanii]MCS3695226.1 hypothetical protein [Bradyrhizobium elkanii]MCS3890622.1 hypothetical protein [Bradyrhizobium elkanii]